MEAIPGSLENLLFKIDFHSKQRIKEIMDGIPLTRSSERVARKGIRNGKEVIRPGESFVKVHPNHIRELRKAIDQLLSSFGLFTPPSNQQGNFDELFQFIGQIRFDINKLNSQENLEKILRILSKFPLGLGESGGDAPKEKPDTNKTIGKSENLKLGTGSFTVDGKEHLIEPIPLSILSFFVQSKNKTLTLSEIIENVFDDINNESTSSESVRNAISKLRKALRKAFGTKDDLVPCKKGHGGRGGTWELKLPG